MPNQAPPLQAAPTLKDNPFSGPTPPHEGGGLVRCNAEKSHQLTTEIPSVPTARSLTPSEGGGAAPAGLQEGVQSVAQQGSETAGGTVQPSAGHPDSPLSLASPTHVSFHTQAEAVIDTAQPAAPASVLASQVSFPGNTPPAPALPGEAQPASHSLNQTLPDDYSGTAWLLGHELACTQEG